MAHIVVVGTGGAGLSTAIFAAKNGCKVSLIEKQDRIGGMLHVANGEFSGAGTKRQKKYDIEDSVEEHIDDVKRLSHNKIHNQLAELSLKNQGETVDWLEDSGFEFHPDCPGLVHGHEVYLKPRTYWGVNMGLSVLKVLEEQLKPLIDEEKIQIFTETKLTKLVFENDRVEGITVSRKGESFNILGDAVVLATGGYDANHEVRNRFMPSHTHDVISGCLEHAQGEGLIAAENIGADVTSDGYFLPIMGMLTDPKNSQRAISWKEMYLQIPPAYRQPHEIWINFDGKRFIAEDTTSPHLREMEILKQPQVAMHIIWDHYITMNAPTFFVNPKNSITKEDYIRECTEGEHVIRANSLQDLAKKLQVPFEILEKTISEYNDAVEQQSDENFGRKHLPSQLKHPPFYAITSRAASILSRDGLKVNKDLQVLDRNGAPILGLYGVGELLGNNVFAGDNYVGGMSITPALTLGRLLGKQLSGAATP